jgi:hypothetical protein
MGIGSVRSILYLIARFLGDVQAVRRGRIRQRVQRRIAGRIMGRLLGRIFRSWAFILALSFTAASCDTAPAPPPPVSTPPSPSEEAAKKGPRTDVPYVPTADIVVDEMLKIASVTSEDILYDLGSGDGRIVITAAQKYGTRGVGIDIDPQRIVESNANAEKAGVTDKVTFRQQDLFQADFSEASVVTMYLLPSVNLRLRPKLLRELKPGTRLVSHNYDMGDWKPDQTLTIPGVHSDGDDHKIYFWVVPPR